MLGKRGVKKLSDMLTHKKKDLFSFSISFYWPQPGFNRRPSEQIKNMN